MMTDPLIEFGAFIEEVAVECGIPEDIVVSDHVHGVLAEIIEVERRKPTTQEIADLLWRELARQIIDGRFSEQ